MATVDQNGIVTGVDIGSADIIVRSDANPSVYASREISVYSPPKKVDLFFIDEDTMQPTDLHTYEWCYINGIVELENGDTVELSDIYSLVYILAFRYIHW